jgi:hypothetical protein
MAKRKRTKDEQRSTKHYIEKGFFLLFFVLVNNERYITLEVNMCVLLKIHLSTLHHIQVD